MYYFLDTCKSLFDSTKVPVAPHISGIGSNKESIALTLQAYKEYGFKRLVVLRGDLPSGYGSKGDFPYAIHLIEFIQNKFDNYFDIEVGAYPETHPEAKSPEDDLKYFCDKLSAGAKGAVTQFFFDAETFLRFRDKCVKQGIEGEIVPGILPVSNYKTLVKFANLTNVYVPDWMHKLYQGTDNDPMTRNLIGSTIAMDMVKVLNQEGVKDFHFYTLNRSDLSYAICHSLGLRPQER